MNQDHGLEREGEIGSLEWALGLFMVFSKQEKLSWFQWQIIWGELSPHSLSFATRFYGADHGTRIELLHFAANNVPERQFILLSYEDCKPVRRQKLVENWLSKLCVVRPHYTSDQTTGLAIIITPQAHSWLSIVRTFLIANVCLSRNIGLFFFVSWWLVFTPYL